MPNLITSQKESLKNLSVIVNLKIMFEYSWSTYLSLHFFSNRLPLGTIKVSQVVVLNEDM